MVPDIAHSKTGLPRHACKREGEQPHARRSHHIDKILRNAAYYTPVTGFDPVVLMSGEGGNHIFPVLYRVCVGFGEKLNPQPYSSFVIFARKARFGFSISWVVRRAK
jgi:hypothetical protein